MGIAALEEFDARQFTLLNWFMWASSFLITVLRIAVRYRHLKRLFWDDAFAILGIVCLTAMAILNQTSRDAIYLIELMASGGTPGPPFTTAEKISSTILAQMKMQFFFMMLFWTTLWSVKGSLLMFYRRLFVGVDGYMKWWWIVVGFCIMTWVISVLTNFMDCMPLRRRFSLDPKDACPNSHAVNAIWVATSIDIASDVLVGLLPIRLLIGLRISTKQKFGIGAIFSLGLVIIVFSIIRLAKIIKSISTSNPNGSVSLALWSMLETSVAVIVGSLPTLKSLITRRGDTGYSSGPKQNTTRGGTKITANSSHIAKGPHIRLYDMQGNGVRSTVRAGYESDEALNNGNKDTSGGITKTHEISVSSQEAGRDGSLESFHHAR